MTSLVFPGRRVVLERFQQVLAAGKLGQAYLFAGPEGAGKEATALEIARLANCSGQPACAQGRLCESCQKAVSFQHPDIRWLGPAPASVTDGEVQQLLHLKSQEHFWQPAFAASSRVTIGDPEDPGPLTMRALLRFLRLRPFQGRLKVAVVADGHRMTAEAANSVLKTLEEPPAASVIFLLAAHRTGILPTILSRCQQVRFEPFEPSELAQLLQARAGVGGDRAVALARLADGNARKAFALLGLQASALLQWAGQLFEWIHVGRAGSLQLAADQLHHGKIPPQMAPAGQDPPPAAESLADKRDRAIQLCEMLNLYYSELLICREAASQWQPRLLEGADAVRAAAPERHSATILRDIESLEMTKKEIDGNMNIGLAMAVLLQGLIDHAQKDAATVSPRFGREGDRPGQPRNRHADKGPAPGEELVIVRFKGHRKSYYHNRRRVPVSVGEYCLVEADRGKDLGRASYVGPGKPVWWREARRQGVIALAQPADLARLHDNRGDEWEFWDICQEKIQSRRLKMNLVTVERQFDHNKITFYFTAEKRVDFRELVRDLAAIFRTRIELRQIGVRDEARLKGGIGVCGREFCCSSHMHDFVPVTLKMAKDQRLPLNPNKLSGPCGRLRCCLTYEHSGYKAALKRLPQIGTDVRLNGQRGIVKKLDLVRELVSVYFLEEQQVQHVPAEDLRWDRNKDLPRPRRRPLRG